MHDLRLKFIFDIFQQIHVLSFLFTNSDAIIWCFRNGRYHRLWRKFFYCIILLIRSGSNIDYVWTILRISFFHRTQLVFPWAYWVALRYSAGMNFAHTSIESIIINLWQTSSPNFCSIIHILAYISLLCSLVGPFKWNWSLHFNVTSSFMVKWFWCVNCGN